MDSSFASLVPSTNSASEKKALLQMQLCICLGVAKTWRFFKPFSIPTEVMLNSGKALVGELGARFPASFKIHTLLLS